MGQYIEILGHPTWVHDDGGDLPALLLLHGGLTGSGNGFGPLPDLLRPHFRLVMFDRRGHGRTADTAEPFHYATMADETAAIIETLGLAPASVVGYSDGGNLLLYLARRRPELLASMVLLSANYHFNAIEPEAAATIRRALTANPAFAEGYAKYSPDGADHWPEVVAKGLRMALDEEPTFEPQDFGVITTPTLVLASDDDQTRTGHASSMYEALPNAQLAIVPNTSHLLVFEKPTLVAQLIIDFVNHPQRAATFLPTHRFPPNAT